MNSKFNSATKFSASNDYQQCSDFDQINPPSDASFDNKLYDENMYHKFKVDFKKWSKHAPECIWKQISTKLALI